MTTTLDNPQAPLAPSKRLTFSLRTLLLMVVFVAAAAALLRQGSEIRQLRAVMAAHDLATDRGELTADTFLIQVTPLARSSEMATYEIAIETLGPRPITVASAISRSQTNMSCNGQPPALTRSHVLISVDLLKAPANQPAEKSTDVLRVLAQVATPNQGSVGGPATYHVPAGKSFDELFQLHIKPGVYPRGKAVALFDLNGEAYTLTIQ